MGPKIKRNPLYISVYLLAASYFFGEFIFPKYNLFYLINIFGIMGLIISTIFFISAFNLFSSYNENPRPSTESKKLIKTGIFAYTRNPIYISFVLFHFSMFLIFENVIYFLTSIGLAFWIHNFVIKAEEAYLIKTFSDEYKRYMNAVSRWIFF